MGEDPTSATAEAPPRSQLPQIWHSSSAQGHILHLNGQESDPRDEGGRWEGSVPAGGDGRRIIRHISPLVLTSP